MGDFKLTFKGKANLCDVSSDIDWHINYSPDSEHFGVDQRILDFFKSLYEEARAKRRQLYESDCRVRMTKMEDK